MKNSQHKLLLPLFIFFFLPQFCFSQAPSNKDLQYTVNRINPYISITKTQIKEANTLIDINPRYDSSWVKAYLSVEIQTYSKGNLKTAISKNDVLTPEQKDLIISADIGVDVSVKVHYIPENNLKHNPPRTITFSFIPEPEKIATFPGGAEQLTTYLKENAIDKIPNGSFNKSNLAALKFTVNENGTITDVHLFESSKNEEVDELLLQTILKMPRWTPSTYAEGTSVKDQFTLTVGNLESCVINLLNIRS